MIEASADIDEGVRVPDSTKIWHLAQVRSGARIGEDCIIGRGAYIGAGVEMGDACKVQNYALLYEPARLGKGVFIGPAAVLTRLTRTEARKLPRTGSRSAFQSAMAPRSAPVRCASPP